jgi:DNA segregation ATPase FtsK/SpoIIIE and related proteins
MAPKQKSRKTSNAQKKKNAANRQKNLKERGIIQDEIILVIALVVSVLLFLSNINLCGTVGKYISNFIFGMIGLEAYVLPLIIFFLTAFRLSNYGNKRAGRKIISAFVFFIAMASFIQMLTDADTSIKIWDYFKLSAASRNGGGIIGGIFVKLFCGLFDEIATYIILIAIMAISIIVITGKAVFSILASKSKDTIKERMEYQKIKKEERVNSPEFTVLEGSRRPAKTFVINETTPSSLQESNQLDIQPQESKNKKQKKNKTEDEQKLPFLNFHTLFEDSTEDKPEDSVITYEDELKRKFGHAEQTEDPFHADDSIQETDTTQTEYHASDIVAEATPPQNKNSRSSSAKGNSTAVDDLNISQKPQQKEYVFPPYNLLSAPKTKPIKGNGADRDLKETAMKLQSTFDSFGVHVTITNVSVGPAVTRYELQPEQGVKVSKITSLADDIKLNLAAADVRIEAPIPGKAAVGIEVPNKENSMVAFREMIESKDFGGHASNLAFAVGKDIGGQAVITDIAKMPHLLIAGATGSGKSVCINTLIMSILYKANPSDVRLIMVDPKVVELNVYNGIPHLLIPVVTDPKKASAALNWAVMEMTERYKKFADVGARDLKGYNEKVAEVEHLKDENFQKLPQIVIIIDELADLMMVAPGEVEDAICRLAQLARAAGIHLIIATQRPSVNVITGLIKANIPSRIAFAVSSAIDSRTILDGSGAEKLLGKGDMLFFPSGYPKPVRIQGAFISDKEVSSVVEFLKKNNNEAVYSDDVHEKINNARPGDLSGMNGGGGDDRDEYFIEAGKFIIEKDKASIGMLQRVYKIGFNRAARIMDQLSEAGVVGPEEGTKPRKILMSEEQFEQYLEEY